MKIARMILLLMLVSIFAFNAMGCSTQDSVEPLKASTSSTEMLKSNEETTEPEKLSSTEDNPMTALEVSRLMGNGTNLGNTMEAYGRSEIGLTADVSSYETIWGQPITTQDMITGMKKAGFDSLRVPIAWTNTMDFENGDYTINKAYLDRVEEIVNYALKADMYVIINDHWDGGWWGMFGSESQDTRDKAMTLYTSMWSQVAERFKDYSYKVIFESANEELGNRLNDKDIARDSGTLSEDECYEMTNVINQKFVDLIRGTSGNNAQRFLLIAGYNTDIEKTIDDRYSMPTDTAKDKLLVSVHYYTPWSYCGTSGMASWGTEGHYNTMNDLLESMTKFTDQGYGVVFGEYAVLTKSDGSIKNNTLEFTKNFLDNCDAYGYVPMLWDTNAFFIRESGKIIDASLSQLYIDRRYENEASLTANQVKENAKASMAAAIDIAIENDKTSTGPTLSGSEEAIAWLMFNSLDYSVTYSVGDIYDPSMTTEGVIAQVAKVESAGTYTIGLDFTGTSAGYADSTVFAAIGITNGELLFPNHIINIKELVINGEPYKLKGVAYTTSDDEICTRLNLYNGWVSNIDLTKARFVNQSMSNFLSAAVLDPNDLDKIETISVTFDYTPSK